MEGQLRTNRIFYPVPDFPKDEEGRALRFEKPSQNIAALEQRTRESFIAMEKTNLIRNRLITCYREEGVNHHENCKEIAEEYAKRINLPANGAIFANQ